MKKIFICIAISLFAFIGRVQGQQSFFDYYMIFGPYSNDFEVSNTQHTSNHTNMYGNFDPDIIYCFVISVAMEITISHCGSAHPNTNVYLLDSNRRMLDYNDDYSDVGACSNTAHAYLNRNLSAGTYYVVSEPINTHGYITTTIRGLVSGGSGASQANAISIGTKWSDFVYSHTKDLGNHSDVNISVPGKDVFYKFTLTVPMDISISNCGSSVPDTYIGLFQLNTSNNQIYWISGNDDCAGAGDCSNMKHAYVKVYGLAPGTYYAVSGGKSSTTGGITTQIRGVVSGAEKKGSTISNPIDIGTKSSSFLFRETLDTCEYPDEFEYECEADENMREGGGVFYKLTLSVCMNISISHEGSDSWDTYIHLLNSSGTCINHDNAGFYGDEQSSLIAGLLAPGVYYIYSEGCNYGCGYITLTVKGELYSSDLSTNQNYILTTTPMVSAKTTIGLTPAQALYTVKYFDGIGRPIQTNQINISPNGADLVTYQEYDAYGRQSNVWLPAVASFGNNGAFVSLNNFSSMAKSTYSNDTHPYASLVYEPSPLNRVLEEYNPGQLWFNNLRSIKSAYLSNKKDIDTLDCYYYSVIEVLADTLLNLTRERKYESGELFVTRMADEDGYTSLKFSNRLGQVVLIRQINRNGTTKTLHDTYYVYDEYGCLMIVLPPEASSRLEVDTNRSWDSKTSSILKDYAYLYKYDGRNRCKAKKLPGCGWIFYIYDQANRLIFTQDSEQRRRSEWFFTLPDAFGRPCVTGICNNSLNALSLVPLTGVIVTIRDNVTSIFKGYASPGITLINPQLLSINYYDNYSFLNKAGIPEFNNNRFNFQSNTDYGNTFHLGTNTLLTGSLVARMEGHLIPSLQGTVMYYNYRKRIIQTLSDNHLGGIEQEFMTYNFFGQIENRRHIHTATGKNTLTEDYNYTYDHANRLQQTTHQLTVTTPGGVKTVNTLIVLEQNTYDELGRLLTSTPNSQTTLCRRYNYNIRSWIQDTNSTYFAESLIYNHNGNIKTKEWIQSGKTQKYTFDYDNLSRLKTAAYTGDGSYGTAYTYDKHGNITNLSRYGNTGTSTHGIVDNLAMTYNGNQLIKVTDTGTTPSISTSADFRSGSAASVQYLYDSNGNLKQDLNKGIGNITYNSLNLPSSFTISNSLGSATNTYVYSADGRKLKVTKGTFTTDYCGNVIYENGSLKRILVDGGYYENGTYYFYLTDHLGNNRVVANQSGAVIQNTQYYPFGMAFADGTNPSAQPYKFGGKELDSDRGLNWYDFHARWQDPALGGRFLSVDPLAEKYYSVSPYVYCLNNPIKYVDPKGEDVYLVTWASHDGNIGHAGIAVDNYKTEVVKDKKGNVVFDKKGNVATQQVKDGTVTYYDLWPGGEGAGKSNYNQDLPGAYNSKIVTLGDLTSVDVSGGEKRAPDGIIQLNTSASTDELVTGVLSAHRNIYPMYNGVSNNCSDYAQAGIESAVPMGASLGIMDERVGSNMITTPNYLYNATVGLPNATVVKSPGNKTNTSFINAIGNNSVRRKIVNNKLQ